VSDRIRPPEVDETATKPSPAPSLQNHSLGGCTVDTTAVSEGGDIVSPGDTWSLPVLPYTGIRFLASAVPSRLYHVSVSGAGLMDPAAVIYSPAIRVDYNVHTLQHVGVVDNLADGLVVMRNDVYAGARLASSVVARNGGTGVVVRGSFFELHDCRLTGNRLAGFEYNPSYTADEALQVGRSVGRSTAGRRRRRSIRRENRCAVVSTCTRQGRI